ncbi:YggN family protein [Pseudoalteromonas fenneropenaei]|uniref:YggN family protein n=1 Tax=Pseudoalteromonas fenneropenaei TaxID=1737459 RepID=A0ABV7CP63_9GAMM
MKKLLLVGSLLAACSATAHENQFNISNDNCSVSFQNDVRISAKEVIVENQANQTMKISRDGYLHINGEQVKLSSEQQYAVAAYSQRLRQDLPQVADIALDAIKLAGVAIDEVGQAFGLNSMSRLHDTMEDLSVDIKNTFYQQDDFVMGEKTFNEFGENFEDKFEAQIEDAVKSTMMESIGNILVTLGSQMVSSGGDMEAFEARMEKLGQDIETKVEDQSKQIELRADKLCEQFSEIAAQESALAAQIPQMSQYQLFTLKTKQSSI